MVFDNFFEEYKLNIKNLKGNIKLEDLPKYRRIFLFVFAIFSTMFVLFLMSLLFFANNNSKKDLQICTLISYFLIPISVFIFHLIDHRDKNCKIMLEEHYKPFSRKRMRVVVNLLEKYNFDISNSDSIDSLINETKLHKRKFYLVKILKNILRFLSYSVPIILGISEFKITKSEIDKIFCFIKRHKNQILAIILLVTLICLLFYLVNLIFEKYSKRDELITDLRQIKIFYSGDKYKKDTTLKKHIN